MRTHIRFSTEFYEKFMRHVQNLMKEENKILGENSDKNLTEFTKEILA